MVHTRKLCFQWWSHDKVSTFCKFIMAEGHHIENCFSATPQQFIVRLTQYLVGISTITWPKYQFSKIKMADGRHFESGFITVSQPRIIRFQWNLVRWLKLCFQGRSHDTRSLALRFNSHFPGEPGLAGDKIVTKCHNFANLKWQRAAILKIVFRLYLKNFYCLINIKFHTKKQNYTQDTDYVTKILRQSIFELC